MEIKKFVIGTMTITCLLGPAALSSYAEECSNKDTISEQSSKTSCQINKEVKESLENNNQTNKHEKNFDVGVQDGWKYSIQQGYAVLVGYSGSQTNITVPGEIKGSQTLIDLSNFSKYVNDISNVKNIKFVKTNGKCSIPGKISSDSWGGNIVAYDSSFSFEKFKNLETFDARGLDTSKITSLRECFFAVRNLKTVNFDDCNVSNVVDIAYMFSECTSLKSASFKNWNTSKVEYIQQMFYKTASLETIDISSFQTPNIKYADYTFCESGAKIIRLDNATLSRASLVSGMFEARSVDKELLVITRDSNLLNNRKTYLYQREPLSTPVLDANGGQFSDQTQTKKYFEKCVYEPEKLNLDNFERFKQENQPTRSGNNHFIEWKPSKEVSNIKNVLDLVGVTYVAQWVQSDWNFQWDSSDNYYKLTEYIGTNRNIVVPNEILGKPTKIDLSSAFPLTNLGGNSPWTNVTSVRFSNDNGKKIKAIGNKIWFNSWSNMTEFDGSGLDTSNINNLERTFENCSKLSQINLNGWNVTNVTTIRNMFANCSSLERIDIKNWNTSNLTDMQGLFYQCTNLKNIDLSSWNTEHVTNMIGVFNGCINLNSVNLKSFNTRNVSSMVDLFKYCYNLKIIDLSSFVLNDYTDTSKMFFTDTDTELLVLTTDKNLKSLDYKNSFKRIPLNGPVLDANGGQFSDQTQTKKYFEKCVYEPEKLNLDNFERFKQENQPTRSGNNHFIEWKPSKEVSNIKNVLDLVGVTYVAQWVQSDWNFQWDSSDNYYKLTEYIGTNRNIVVPNEILGKPTKIDLSSAFPLTNLGGNSPWTNVTSVRFSNDNGKKIKAIGNKIWFNSWSNMTEFDGSGLDTSNINNLERTFENCSKLSQINLNGWNVTNVTTIRNMFANCSSLERIDIKNWNTSNLTDMQGLFYQCTNLKNIDLSSWNTENVIDMSYLFYNCYALENIDLSGWDTAKVQWMGRMFHNTKISSLDIRHFKTPSLVSTNRMFNGCSKLKVIRMDNFDMSKVTDSAAMFYRGKGTETLVVTKDNQLLTNYRFNSDNTHPLTKPALNANGGSFENSQEVKNYFEKVAVLPEDLQLTKFEEFKDINIPTKSNNIFRCWEETTSSKSSEEGVLDLLDKSYRAIWKNMICNTTVDNKKLTTEGIVGFVYLPNQFFTAETKLQEEGEQRIPFNKKQSLNIGVRDLSQSRSSWSVTGQLNWLSKEIPGAYIQIENNKDSIKKNINDNVKDFDSSRDLVDVNEEVSAAPSSDGYLKITSNSANRLIEANTNKTHDDIYDYDLGNADLVIPDTKYVQEGKHTAAVEWNLTNAPQ